MQSPPAAPVPAPPPQVAAWPQGAAGYAAPNYYGQFQPMATQPPEERATAATVLSIIGGVLIFLAGLLEIAAGYAAAQYSFGLVGGTYVVSGFLGLVLGVIIIVLGAILYSSTRLHVTLGVIIIVLSVLSLVSFFGGFVVGFILALIGGILAVAHKPQPQLVTHFVPQPPPIQRVCPKCGRVVDPSIKFCPHCGNPLG